MALWDGKYSPTEMLDYCKVSPFDSGLGDQTAALTTELLAMIAIAEDHQSLIEDMKTRIYEYSKVSIGTGLRKLHNIATTGPELEHGRDGLDALAYHLSADTCKKGIVALQAVLKRFEELK